MKLISDSEISFIISGCEAGIRGDGRGLDDYRSISIETSIYEHVNGSSRVFVNNSTDVICSVKFDICQPSNLRPNKGLLDVGVDISPACNLKLDDKDLSSIELSVADNIQRSYVGCGKFPWKELCILPGKFAWIVQIDLLILNMDGDPSDICSIASYVALQTAILPKVIPTVGPSGEYDNFEVIGDIREASKLNCYGLPILINVLKLGKSFLIDGSSSEEQCAHSITTVGISLDGTVANITTTKGGSLEPNDFETILQKSIAAGLGIFERLQIYLTSKAFKPEEEDFPDNPPIRNGLLN